MSNRGQTVFVVRSEGQTRLATEVASLLPTLAKAGHKAAGKLKATKSRTSALFCPGCGGVKSERAMVCIGCHNRGASHAVGLKYRDEMMPMMTKETSQGTQNRMSRHAGREGTVRKSIPPHLREKGWA